VKIFADTADVNEIRRLAAMGLVDGVTTNPSLVARTGRDYADVVKEICGVVDGPISAEVIATEAGAMVEASGWRPSIRTSSSRRPWGRRG
jgi:transaldolase